MEVISTSRGFLIGRNGSPAVYNAFSTALGEKGEDAAA